MFQSGFKNHHIDLWSKKFVVFPINLQSHWSLCVAVNVNNFSDYIARGAYKLDTEITFVMLLELLVWPVRAFYV
jgi:hypothetical protein